MIDDRNDGDTDENDGVGIRDAIARRMTRRKTRSKDETGNETRDDMGR